MVADDSACAESDGSCVFHHWPFGGSCLRHLRINRQHSVPLGHDVSSDTVPYLYSAAYGCLPWCCSRANTADAIIDADLDAVDNVDGDSVTNIVSMRVGCSAMLNRHTRYI